MTSFTAFGPAGIRHTTRAAIATAAALAVGCASPPAPVVAPAPAPTAAPTPAPLPAAAPAWRPAASPLMTRWAADVTPDNVLPEYPRPQLVRQRWQNLNGLWEFAVRPDSTSALPFGRLMPQRILVPFAPEAALSGVGTHADRVVYRRTFTRPAGMLPGERLLMNFGAVDWQATVFVNGTDVGHHSGGYESFSIDVTDALTETGPQEVLVSVYDPTDAFGQPRGKQVSKPEGIWYTPVTGIWQTVWLEPVPAASIEALDMTPDVAGGALRLTVRTRGGAHLIAEAFVNGQSVGRTEGVPGKEMRLPVPNAHLWNPDDPFLYDLRVILHGPGGSADTVTSYFGMRTSGLVRDFQGRQRMALNGKVLFQLGPLDQGWWPDGLYTAPTDAALRSDIETMKALGYSMVRKHIKVEPARWYYYADRLGLPVWQDMPSGWNDTPEARAEFEKELRAMIAQLRSHPSIVTWVPFNEKWGEFDTRRIADLVKGLDSSRLVNEGSGWQGAGAGDIIDVHRYQGPQAMNPIGNRAAVVGEFGGLGYKVAGHTWAAEGWGYSGLFTSTDSLQARYDLLMKRMWDLQRTHGMSAGVYTQLTDVEVEVNGLMTYDRAVMKFDTARTAAVNRGLAPYVLPELPEFTDAVKVSMTSGVPTQIRYTLDGSEPNEKSRVYDAPFTVRATTTVRARSFVNGRPTGAPESRTAYTKVAGRAPEVLARDGSNALFPGLDVEVYHERTKEPAYRMDWPIRWRVEHPETRAGDPKPVRTAVARTISLAPSDTAENFALRFTGYFRAPRTGVYTFMARSDDGAALWVGDTFVFGSLGQSPATTETPGQIALQAGLHPITFSYFQAYGPKHLQLFVEGPGLSRREIPASMLFRARTYEGATPAASGGSR